MLDIDYGTHTMKVNGKVVREGDWISLDGTTGEVIDGKVPTKPSEVLQVLVGFLYDFLDSGEVDLQ